MTLMTAPQSVTGDADDADDAEIPAFTPTPMGLTGVEQGFHEWFHEWFRGVPRARLILVGRVPRGVP